MMLELLTALAIGAAAPSTITSRYVEIDGTGFMVTVKDAGTAFASRNDPFFTASPRNIALSLRAIEAATACAVGAHQFDRESRRLHADLKCKQASFGAGRTAL